MVADMSRELDWPWTPIIIEEEVEEVTASGARSAPADTLLSALSGSVLVVFRLLSEEPSDLELTLTNNNVLFLHFLCFKIQFCTCDCSFSLSCLRQVSSDFILLTVSLSDSS